MARKEKAIVRSRNYVRTAALNALEKWLPTYVKSQGIEHNPTAAFSPQLTVSQNEWNRTLSDMVCPMLDAAGAPVELRAYGLLTACHIRNRLPTRSLDAMSPDEAWTGQKPRVSHIRKFGCLVYRHIITKSVRKKLGRKVIWSATNQLASIVCIIQKSTPSKTWYSAKTNSLTYDDANPPIISLNLTIRPPISKQTLITPTTTTTTTSVTSYSGQNDEASPIIHHEIVVQPLPEPTNTRPAPQPSPPNRRQRRALAKIAKAFTANVWRENYKQAISMDDAEQWQESVKRELASLYKNQTWTVVPRPRDAKVVKSRWVFRIKGNDVSKTHFCAKGFTQRWGEDYDETFAPVAKYTSIRTLLVLVDARSKSIKWMWTPRSYTGTLTKWYISNNRKALAFQRRRIGTLLNKALYDLKQSPRACFLKIAPTFVEFDFEQWESNPCFVYANDKDEKTYVALYVDDFIIASENEDEIAASRTIRY